MPTTQVQTTQTTWTASREPDGSIAAAAQRSSADTRSSELKPAPEPFIDKIEVARRLGLRPRTVDDWMKRGLLPYYKPGHYVRFRWSEIQALLAQNSRVCRREIRLG